MNPDNTFNPLSQRRWFRYLFGWTLFMLALTGFGQMPIFKRYYIADIPGMAWLAHFFVTHYIHYISATVFLGLCGVSLTERAVYGADIQATATFRYVKAILLAILAITGILLVMRNFPGYRFSPGFIMFLDFTHLGATVVFLMTALISAIMGWIRSMKPKQPKEIQ